MVVEKLNATPPRILGGNLYRRPSMANVNKVILIGNLTRDPESKDLPSGTTICDFGLAVNRTWKDAGGNKKEEVLFVDCSAFGRTSEVIAEHLRKGNPIYIEGRLKLDQWEAQDGSKRSKIRVVVDNFQFIGSKSDGEGSGQRQQESQPPRQQARPQPQGQRKAQPAADVGYRGEEDAAPVEDADIPF
jgi:single-strand DNA-binding protein